MNGKQKEVVDEIQVMINSRLKKIKKEMEEEE